jgi:hypothetical protein
MTSAKANTEILERALRLQNDGNLGSGKDANTGILPLRQAQGQNDKS